MGSATKRGASGDEFDRYYTPKWAVDLCRYFVLDKHFKHLGDTPTILEPGAGKGVFVDGMREHYPKAHIMAIDVDPSVGPWTSADDSYEGDFRDAELTGHDIDLVIGNPPYRHAEDFLVESLAITSNVIMLLRIGFLASKTRYEFFQKNKPSYVSLFTNRLQFLADGNSDSSEYILLSWSAQAPKRTELLWLPNVPLEVRRGDINLIDHDDYKYLVDA